MSHAKACDKVKFLSTRVAVLRLVGCTSCFRGRLCVLGSYGDLVCRAVGLTIVVVAALNRAVDSLDVLASVLFLIH